MESEHRARTEVRLFEKGPDRQVQSVPSGRAANLRGEWSRVGSRRPWLQVRHFVAQDWHGNVEARSGCDVAGALGCGDASCTGKLLRIGIVAVDRSRRDQDKERESGKQRQPGASQGAPARGTAASTGSLRRRAAKALLGLQEFEHGTNGGPGLSRTTPVN